MNIEKIKQESRSDVQKNITQLIVYLSESNPNILSEIRTYDKQNPEYLFNLLSYLMLLYYAVSHLAKKEITNKVLMELSNVSKEHPISKEILSIYLDLVSTKDINPHLSAQVAKEKDLELFKLIKIFC